MGGYGRLGSLVVRELVETTTVDVVVAGRSIQRADELALSCGERVGGAYADAADGRTLRALVPGASAVVACCGDDALAVLETALEARVPFLSPGAAPLEPRTERSVRERAWSARLPVVMHAGAVPGLPAVLCEWLVRRIPDIDLLRVASTGPWLGTETARRDVARARAGARRRLEYRERIWTRAPARSVRWEFPGLGERSLRPSLTPDLAAFPEGHRVESLCALEPDPGWLERGLERALRLPTRSDFAASAEAYAAAAVGRPTLRIGVAGADVTQAAAAVLGALVRAVLARRAPAGLSTPRDAVNPSVLLDALEKRRVRVLTPPP